MIITIRTKFLLLSIFISLAIASLVEYKVFIDAAAINDDMRNQIYWMARLVEPNLFPNDLIASYFTQPKLVSPILEALYRLSSNYVDPLLISQILPFFLVVISTFFLFKVSELSFGYKYAFWVCYGFNLMIWMMNDLSGGLPRAFFYPLFFLFLWMLIKRNWIGLIVSFVLQTMIYPISFFLSTIVLLIEIFSDKLTQIKTGKVKLIASISGLIIGGSILCVRYLYKQPANGFGSLINSSEALQMKEFYADGRVNVFLIPYTLINNGLGSQFFLENQEFIINWIVRITIFSILIVLAYWFYKKFLIQTGPLKIPRYIWSSTIAATIITIFALFNLFYLYIPQRYLGYIIPLLLVFIISSYIHHIELAFPKHPYLIVLLASIAFISTCVFWDDDLIHLSKKQSNLYSFLHKVPHDALIAAPIDLSSDIPAFAYRSVLISSEANIPFHKIYYTQIQARVHDWLEAYEAKDTQTIISFINKYGIDYIVLDSKDFTDKKDMIFATISKKCLIFNSGKYSVVSADKVLSGCL